MVVQGGYHRGGHDSYQVEGDHTGDGGKYNGVNVRYVYGNMIVSGGSSGGSGGHCSGHVRNEGAIRGQGLQPYPSHPQNKQIQKFRHQVYGNGGRSR